MGYEYHLVTTVTKRCTFLSSTKQSETTMECGTDESVCLNLESEDLDRLGNLTNLYFSARENEEESFDSDSDNSSSDEDDDYKSFDFNEDEDMELMEVHLSERAKVQKFYAETCHCKLGVDEKACSLSLTLDNFADSRNN